jgi:CubicO group peptidase (beta-lactamase class C family)
MSRRGFCSGALGAGAALVLPRAGAFATDDPFAAVDAVVDARVRQTKGRGLLAIARRGRLLHVAGFGMDRTADYPIFSISKTVTALALATLVQDGRLTFDDTVDRHLGDLMRSLGPPADPRLAGVTIRQLLTHTAGLLSNSEDDEIMSRRQIARTRGDQRAARREDVLALILKQKLPRAPGETYAYSNMGYVVLGSVVEAVAGQPYEDYCRARVLKPLGLLKPAIDPDLRYGDSYLGWRMTGPEVLRLLEAYEESDTRVLGPAMHGFAGMPHNSWISEQKTAFYSLGVFARRGASGALTWWSNGYGQGSSLDKSISTLAARGAGGVAAVWMVAPRLERDRYYEFDRAVWAPLREIKTWPDRDLYPRFGL